ncbi:MAG: hypothetical protein E6833_15890 [Bradyrhizobium sp.]|nr:hypothetical protein [Bradyrhizobium sp.]
MIVGHEVHVVTPLVVIDAGTAGGDHEVGGLRLGGDLEQGVALLIAKETLTAEEFAPLRPVSMKAPVDDVRATG